MLRNGFECLPKNERKTILFLSDDMRLPSGVGTMSREIILGTCHYFNFIQIGGALSHPDMGKKLDLSQAISNETGVEDASVFIYPYNGYGDENILRFLLNTEHIDILLHFTDPRFFTWLYHIEHEIRQRIPIYYLALWDDLPYPKWNAPFYASCDLIMSISKQSYGIHKKVLEMTTKDYVPSPVEVTYVPHGVNESKLYPIRNSNMSHQLTQVEKKEDGTTVDTAIAKTDIELISEMRHNFFGGNEVNFVVLYVNRNVRRKLPGDVILAYKTFCDSLTPEQASKCALIMHTQPVDDNGTNLLEVVDNLCPYRVVFSVNRLEPYLMNVLYNIADVTINLASNEGFGLGTCESLMAGTPIIVNVTGGLQDQCGFWLDGKELTADDYLEIQSLHDRDKWEHNDALTHGTWAFPVWPSNISLQGSVPTPYIFDDRPSYKDAAIKIKEVYDTDSDTLNFYGDEGHKFVTSESVGMSSAFMSNRIMKDITNNFINWMPRKKFSIFNV